MLRLALTFLFTTSFCCNPAALARDLEMLAQVYTPEVIQAVDLFPQTAHLETIVRLKRK